MPKWHLVVPLAQQTQPGVVVDFVEMHHPKVDNAPKETLDDRFPILPEQALAFDQPRAHARERNGI